MKRDLDGRIIDNLPPSGKETYLVVPLILLMLLLPFPPWKIWTVIVKGEKVTGYLECKAGNENSALVNYQSVHGTKFNANVSFMLFCKSGDPVSVYFDPRDPNDSWVLMPLNMCIATIVGATYMILHHLFPAVRRRSIYDGED